jgi:hypothetical protein
VVSDRNKIRLNNKSNLTGIHMVRNNDYYIEKLKKSQEKWYNIKYTLLDEIMLKNMMKEVFGLPDLSYQFRPVLGIHFSLNRGYNKLLENITKKKYFEKFMKIKNKYNDLFKFPVFNSLYEQLLKFKIT